MKGEGVEKDEAKGASMYLKSAEQGYANAQYEIGKCYCEGIGVGKNYVEGRAWLKKAADQGQEDAIAYLAVLDAEPPAPFEIGVNGNNVNVSNNTDQNTTAVLVVAMKRGNRIVATDKRVLTLQAGETIKLQLSATSPDSDTATAEIYLLNMADGAPLCACCIAGSIDCQYLQSIGIALIEEPPCEDTPEPSV